MKIKAALKKSKNTLLKTVSSGKAGMSRQDANSFVHWILMNGTNLERVKELVKILEADDWELD